MQQPYASFAQTLLEVQHYPDLREFRGGPPKRPYDVTAHTLPLLMNVDAVPLDDLQVPLEALIAGGAIPTPSFDFQLPEEFKGDQAPRIGLYKSAQEPMEGGWTRWMFDQHVLQYDTLKDERARKGALVEDYDVIVFQDQSKESIENGYRKGTVPDSYAGGLGRGRDRSPRSICERGRQGRGDRRINGVHYSVARPESFEHSCKD